MSDDNVFHLPPAKGAPTPVADVVGSDMVKNSKALLVIGWDENEAFFLGATHGSIRDNLYLLDICKHSLLKYVTDGGKVK